jgi:hypothetical protein
VPRRDGSGAFVAPNQAGLELGNPPLDIEDAEREQIRIHLRQAEELGLSVASAKVLGRANSNKTICLIS